MDTTSNHKTNWRRRTLQIGLVTLLCLFVLLGVQWHTSRWTEESVKRTLKENVTHDWTKQSVENFLEAHDFTNTFSYDEFPPDHPGLRHVMVVQVPGREISLFQEKFVIITFRFDKTNRLIDYEVSTWTGSL